MAKQAHERDITFNNMVLSIIKDGLKDGQWKLFLSTGIETVIFEKGEIKNSEQ